MQFPFIYLIVFCLLVILFLVWYIQRTKQRKKFLEQEHKYDQALLEVHAIETEYYISLLRDKQEELKNCFLRNKMKSENWPMKRRNYAM